MNNRELLELAAKAAGYRFKTTDELSFLIKDKDLLWRPWNPLESDADAFRLSVHLGIGIEHNKYASFDGNSRAITNFGSYIENWRNHSGNQVKATCYAITRAAASLDGMRGE